MSNPLSQGKVTEVISSIGIATIEFEHPMSNSLPANLLTKLTEAITKAGNNDLVKVVVLKSAGQRAFCGGASFEELASIEDLDEGKRFFSGFANDFCYATSYASVKLSELAVGIGPFVVGPAVARKIGNSAMSMLAINATNWYSAAWAKEQGLYANVFDSTEEMDQAIDVLANKLSSSNPEAMRLLKKTFWENTENWDELLAERAAVSGQLVLSDFTKHAIAAFKSK